MAWILSGNWIVQEKRWLWWHSTISTDQAHIRTFLQFCNPFYNWTDVPLTIYSVHCLMHLICQRPWDLDDFMPIFKPWFVLCSRSSHLIRILIECAVTHCPFQNVTNIQPNEIMSLSYEIATLKLLTRQMPCWTDTSFLYVFHCAFFPASCLSLTVSIFWAICNFPPNNTRNWLNCCIRFVPNLFNFCIIASLSTIRSFQSAGIHEFCWLFEMNCSKVSERNEFCTNLIFWYYIFRCTEEKFGDFFAIAFHCSLN